jgi:hypothetical protein
MHGSLMLISTMSKITLSVRSVGMALLILAAVGHADSNANLPASGPQFSGLGRLGRDLIRRTSSEETAGLRVDLDGLIPARSGRGPRTDG